MSLYTLIIVTFVIFMAINVIIGLRGRKHASTTKDFLTASGQSGIWFIIASAVGASIGSGVVIGTTQYAVKLGVAGAWYAIACGLACVVHAFVMTRFIYRNKLVSFSDYFKRRYDSNFIVLLYSGIGPFACAASMGGQLVAAKAIFQAFGIDPTIGLVITAAVMLVYHYALRYAGSAAGRHHLETRHDKGRSSFCSCWYDHGAAEHLRRDYCSVFQHFSCAPRRSGLHCCESLHQACAD